MRVGGQTGNSLSGVLEGPAWALCPCGVVEEEGWGCKEVEEEGCKEVEEEGCKEGK